MKTKHLIRTAFVLYWALVLSLCVYTQFMQSGPDPMQQTGLYGAVGLLLVAMIAYISRQYQPKHNA